MRFVVRVEEPEGDKVFVAMEDGPVLRQGARRLRVLDGVPEELLDNEQSVKQVGEQLFASLTTSHSEIDFNVQVVLAKDECSPIYLLMNSPTSAQYPWETLFDPDTSRFLALEDRWPIARITELSPAEKKVNYFAPPLKVLAVLSAVNVDAAGEWRELWGALQRCAVPFEVHAVVGQRSLKEEIESIGDRRVSCAALKSLHDLRDHIENFKPHLVHFFCHGRAAEAPVLMFGTQKDHVSGRSSVVCEADYLRGLSPDAWLVTLNCCEGASDREGVRSLAHLLVAAGYPAVVGWREPVPEADANLFTRAFYGKLVQKLSTDLAQTDPVELEITTMLSDPRQALRDRFVPDLEPREAAATHREWSNPVLYVRSDPLLIQPEEAAGTRESLEYLTAKLGALHRARAGLHADTPTEVLDEIDAEIGRLLQELRR